MAFSWFNKKTQTEQPIAPKSSLSAPPGSRPSFRGSITAPPTNSSQMAPREKFPSPFVDQKAADKAESLRRDKQQRDAPSPGVHLQGNPGYDEARS